MSKVKFVAVDSKAAHTWIEMHEVENGTTYTMPIGMIQPDIEGFLATGMHEQKIHGTFAAAKQYIVNQYTNKN